MTSVAGGTSRRLAAFTVPSEPGNERMALAQVASAVAGTGLSADQMDRLKTAVAEATMNAIEHGNDNRPEIPVDVEVLQTGTDIIVTISDQGGDQAPSGPAQEPDLLAKLAGAQTPRGWGLFLIRHMVDAMDVTSQGSRHTVRLVMRADAGADQGGSHDQQM